MGYNPVSLEERRILVTGASSGIGRATAILLSRLGAHVVCVARNRDRLRATIDSLEGKGHQQRECDLEKLDGIQPMIEEMGPFHGLVHAAGVQSTMPLTMIDEVDWTRIIRVNTEAALLLAKGFVRRRPEAPSGGSIVFISSVMGRVGAPGAVMYSLSKGAVEGMTRSMAVELSSRRIRVNCVSPGYVKTEMLDEVSRLWSPEQRSRVESLHPLGFGEALDVAHAIAFLLAECSRWITGTILTVDGGYTAQ